MENRSLQRQSAPATAAGRFPALAPPARAFAPTSTAALTVNPAARTGGQSLDAQTQTEMGAKFGHDFSQVRIFADEQAAASAESVSARAYTTGSNIVFRQGQYAPGTSSGKRLLAHELTHVVQQSRFGLVDDGPVLSRKQDASEGEADRLSSQIMLGHGVQVAAAPQSIVARDEDDDSNGVCDPDADPPVLENPVNPFGIDNPVNPYGPTDIPISPPVDPTAPTLAPDVPGGVTDPLNPVFPKPPGVPNIPEAPPEGFPEAPVSPATGGAPASSTGIWSSIVSGAITVGSTLTDILPPVPRSIFQSQPEA